MSVDGWTIWHWKGTPPMLITTPLYEDGTTGEEPLRIILADEHRVVRSEALPNLWSKRYKSQGGEIVYWQHKHSFKQTSEERMRWWWWQIDVEMVIQWNAYPVIQWALWADRAGLCDLMKAYEGTLLDILVLAQILSILFGPICNVKYFLLPANSI